MRLRDRIAREGPITFAEYMRAALYDPEHGYYSGDEPRTGRAGDYMTSPELDPAFGALWARGVEQVWDACGRPGVFDVVELGPGEGGLARAFLVAASGGFGAALHLTLVEPAEARRRRLRTALGARVRCVASLSEVPPIAHGCVLANEVLDNQPVHVLRNNDDALEELHIAIDGDALIERWLACTNRSLVARARETAAERAGPIEVSPDAEGLARDCISAVETGAAIFIDYGREAAVDTLVSYSAAGAGEVRLDHAGLEDITAHVDWRAVARSCEVAGATCLGPLAQADVLRALGAGDHDDQLRREHERALDESDGAAAVRSLSRRHALRALLNTSGLGGLQVLVAIKAIAPPPFANEKTGPRAGLE